MEGGQALRQRCLFHPQGEEQHGDELFKVSNFFQSGQIGYFGPCQNFGGEAAGVAGCPEQIG